MRRGYADPLDQYQYDQWKQQEKEQHERDAERAAEKKHEEEEKRRAAWNLIKEHRRDPTVQDMIDYLHLERNAEFKSLNPVLNFKDGWQTHMLCLFHKQRLAGTLPADWELHVCGYSTIMQILTESTYAKSGQLAKFVPSMIFNVALNNPENIMKEVSRFTIAYEISNEELGKSINNLNIDDGNFIYWLAPHSIYPSINIGNHSRIIWGSLAEKSRSYDHNEITVEIHVINGIGLMGDSSYNPKDVWVEIGYNDSSDKFHRSEKLAVVKHSQNPEWHFESPHQVTLPVDSMLIIQFWGHNLLLPEKFLGSSAFDPRVLYGISKGQEKYKSIQVYQELGHYIYNKHKDLEPAAVYSGTMSFKMNVK